MVSNLTTENIDYILSNHSCWSDKIDLFKPLTNYHSLAVLDKKILNDIVSYCKNYHYNSFEKFVDASSNITQDSFEAYVKSKHQPSIDVELFPTLELRTKSYEEIGKDKQK